MPGATIPVNGQGTVTWVNNSNNWRQEDASFLQGRMVVRWANNIARSTSGGDNLGQGSLSYLIDGSRNLAVNTSAGAAGWSNILHSTLLTYTDTPGTDFKVQYTGAPGSLHLASDGGVFADTKVTIGTSNAAPKIKLDSSGTPAITFDMGSGNFGTISTNPANRQVTISAGAGLSVNNLTVSGSASFSSVVSFATANFSSLATTDLTANGTITINGSGGLNAVNGVVNAQTFVNPTGYTLGSTGLTRVGNAGAGLSITNSIPSLSGSPDVNLVVAPSGHVVLNQGTNKGPVACYNYSINGPGTTPGYPEGTIWLQVI